VGGADGVEDLDGGSEAADEDHGEIGDGLPRCEVQVGGCRPGGARRVDGEIAVRGGLGGRDVDDHRRHTVVRDAAATDH
jgi:hypothetical protein